MKNKKSRMLIKAFKARLNIKEARSYENRESCLNSQQRVVFSHVFDHEFMRDNRVIEEAIVPDL